MFTDDAVESENVRFMSSLRINFADSELQTENRGFPQFETDFGFPAKSSGSVGLRLVGTSQSIDAALVRTSSYRHMIVKRVIDVILCSVGFPILLPLFVMIALAVRLSSPGPIFYREERVGRFGRPFIIFKFRSMFTKEYLHQVLDHRTREEDVIQRRLHQKREPDCRITGVGSILRKLSMDELPQLLNVILGDMSLVGPRPVVEAELDRYGAYAKYYKMALPGITGLWQVSGRNDVSYERRVRMDTTYCKKWSPLLDLKILARTVPAVLKGKGAY